MAGAVLPRPGDRFDHRLTGARGQVRIVDVVFDDIDDVSLVVFRYVSAAHARRPVAVLPLVEFERVYPERVPVVLEAVR
jgi:hypothetical protein